MVSQVNGWPEILGYIGSRREMEEWTSVLIGLPWDRMNPLCCHTTTEGTNRRQEQELRMTLKGGWVCWCEKKMGIKCKGVLEA
jgi:hypothetical protein